MMHAKCLAQSQAGRGFPVTWLGLHYTNEEVDPRFRAGPQPAQGHTVRPGV